MTTFEFFIISPSFASNYHLESKKYKNITPLSRAAKFKKKFCKLQDGLNALLHNQTNYGQNQIIKDDVMLSEPDWLSDEIDAQVT